MPFVVCEKKKKKKKKKKCFGRQQKVQQDDFACENAPAASTCPANALADGAK
jgi:hypothetical protein